MKKTRWSIVLGMAVLLLTYGCGGGGGGGGGGSPTFTVGGMVSGLTAGSSIVLQLNGANDLTVSGDADGIVPFTFTTALAVGADYEITVKTPPAGVGHYWSVANASGTINNAIITDVRVNGQLDDAFGEDDNGIAVSNGAAGFLGNDIGYKLARYTTAAGGKILVAGESSRASGDSDMTIWRYNADGTIDDTFGTNGVVKYDGGFGNDAGYAITLADPASAASDILVAGVVTNASDRQIMTVWRIDATGDPVAAFGTNGVKSYTEDPTYTSSRGNSILVDASGKILVAGYRNDGIASELAVWRRLGNGALDGVFNSGVAAFSGNGSISGNFNGVSMALVDPTDPASAILVTGTATTDTTSKMIIWKYNAVGQLVLTFGGYDGITDGVLVYTGSAGSNHAGYSLTLADPSEPTSEILVTGYNQNASSYADMAIWRFDTTGDDLMDSVATSNNAAGGNGDDQGFSITTDEEGDIYVTGKSANASSGYDMVIWKYLSTGDIDTSFGLNGILIDNSAAGGDYWAIGTSMTVVPVSGKIIVAGCSSNSSNNLDMVIWQYYP